MHPRTDGRNTQQDSQLPSLGEILGLLDATGVQKKAQEASSVQQLADRQATTDYAQNQGFPSLQALQLSQSDEDHKARLAAFEQSKQEQLGLQKQRVMGSALENGSAYLDPNQLKQMWQQYLAESGVQVPAAPVDPRMEALKRHQQSIQPTH